MPAGKGDAEAQYYVARIHANGMDNVTINYAEAARWYEKAADQGFSEARQELGYLYERGLGVAKDPLKALNLQRAASGLGEALDYAWKIADAQALADSLATQLQAANGALLDSQLALSETQDQLFAARAGVRQQELQMVGLIASLEEARRLAANSASPEVDQLEQEISTITARLEQSQAAILRLERERDSARAALATQLADGQATQLELRELLARTERTEREAESLGAQLAEAQQRLIHSDEEVRELQTAFREQSERLAPPTGSGCWRHDPDRIPMLKLISRHGKLSWSPERRVLRVSSYKSAACGRSWPGRKTPKWRMPCARSSRHCNPVTTTTWRRCATTGTASLRAILRARTNCTHCTQSRSSASPKKTPN